MGRLDLKPATGRYEAGSVLDTRVAAHDAEDQLTTLAFDGGELVVPHLDAPIGERVRARIRARDVSLALAQAGRNQHPQRASGAASRRSTRRAGPIVDVQLAVGGVDARRAHHAPLVAGSSGFAPGRRSMRWSRPCRSTERSVGYA